MLIVIITVGVIAIIAFIGIIAICNKSDDKDANQVCAFLGFIFVLCLFICVFAISEYFSPSINPMDVYRGKTTLKYEIIDGVKVDSTVVWKEEKS